MQFLPLTEQKVEAMSQAIMLSGTGSILHLKDSVINGNSYAVNLSNGTINIENTVIMMILNIRAMLCQLPMVPR